MSPSKRLVIFSDGTWVGRETEVEGAPPSNIRHLANMVGRVQFSNPPGQEPTRVHPIKTRNPNVTAGYQEGVGLNATFLEYIWDGATGATIGEECTSVYKFIVEHFTDEHEIWMFGYSRGAFIIRCVGGMINNCGIVNRHAVLGQPNRTMDDVATLCKEVYRTYRSPLDIDHPHSDRCENLRRSEYLWHIEQPVRFLGLIDTVGGLGIPRLNPGIGLDWPEFEFHDQACSSVVQTAYQAASLHERLWALQPCLIFPGKTGRTKVRQMWFPGCHHDLGRQTSRFLKQRPWNDLERWLGTVPNLLSKTVWPNAVLADVVLRWVLQAVKDEEGAADKDLMFPNIDDEITELGSRIANPSWASTGSGEVYDDFLVDSAPLGYVLGALKRLIAIPIILLNFLFPRFGSNISDLLGIQFLTSVLMATNDRRIPGMSEHGEVYPYQDDEMGTDVYGNPMTFTVQGNGRMKELNDYSKVRYPSQTYETFMLWRSVFDGARDGESAQ